MTEQQALYRLYDSTGTLLYVGVSLNVAQRMSQHRAVKPWWTDVARIELEHYDTRGRVLAAELAAIRAEAPLYNVQYAERPALVEAPPQTSAAELRRQRAALRRTERKITAAVSERQAAEAAVEDARREEAEAIHAALDAGLRQVDIVAITGWTRETIRRLADKARADG